MIKSQDRTEDIYAEEYSEYLKSPGLIRSWIRGFYLRDIRSHIIGKAIDFGCGTGTLLELLQEGSVGYEVNPEVVRFCSSKGLKVFHFNPLDDGYSMDHIHSGEFQTFTMNHVLEHLTDPVDVFNQLSKRCFELGIERIVLTVPGIKGYNSDQTHRTYIDLDFVKRFFQDQSYYRLTKAYHYPFNNAVVCKFFTHNELRLIFDRG